MTYPGLSLEGRVAVVMGGTSGIGRSIALGFARAGAELAASSRRQSEVDSTADAIETLGRRALRKASDVTRRSSLERLLEAALGRFGKVDILVNCESASGLAPGAAAQDFDASQETNLAGAVRACQVFGRHMLERGYGRIVNVASLASFGGLSEVTPYTGDRSGLAGLTRTLAVDWGGRGVLVNAIAPGVVESSPRARELVQRTPLKRLGDLEELVGPAIFLASEASSFVNGHVLVVDGGFSATGV
ncbi:MAG TPA: SDR family oxidoreductase [Polyangiaceae bacterium]